MIYVGKIEKIIKVIGERKLGEKKITFRLKDWGVSRQRYWGCPIPIVYDSKGKALPVNKKDLPVLLPNDVDLNVSGNPLDRISTNMIKKFYKELNNKVPIIGVGGISSGKSAYEKITAGASLLQLYTGFVYKGPSTAKIIKKELIQILKSEGIENIKDAVGKLVN